MPAYLNGRADLPATRSPTERAVQFKLMDTARKTMRAWLERRGNTLNAPAKVASIIFTATGNLRAVHILLGNAKIESTVRYLGVDVEDALELAKLPEA